MKRLEHIINDYWAVSYAMNSPDPEAPVITTEKALKKLNSADRLRTTESRLSARMHCLRYDIIEGHTEWRSKESHRGSALILPMRG